MLLQIRLNALLIFILSGVLISAFGVQFIGHEKPCPLCLLQRIGMISVACGAAFNLCFGIRSRHYGLILLSALFGGAVALRQISLHVCPGFSTFGIPVLGLSLYTWSFIVFISVILYTAFLLLLYSPAKASGEKLGIFEKSACFTILMIAIGNFLSTLFECGFGPCVE